MKKILFIAALLLPTLSWAQQTNHIRTTVYKTETSSSIADPTAGQAIQDITYFDRLGRPTQQRAYRQSGSGKDIVTHIEYDASGQQVKNFLPYVSTSATDQYDANAATEVLTFYASPTLAKTGNPDFEATGNPFSQNLFETSPLGRVSKMASPGSIWKLPDSPADPDRTVKTEYYSNTATDNVKLYKAVAGVPFNGYFPATLSQQGVYEAGKLYKTVAKTENWISGNAHTVQEFKNKQGQLLLKRTWGPSLVGGIQTEGWHDTYYVYDQYDNLTFVLPPMSDGSGSQADLDGLCYQYRFDGRNRLVERKEPGKSWEYIIYDNLNRIAATGPTFSPFPDIPEPNNIGWLFTKYDVFGRVAYTGWMQASVTSADRNTIQAALNTQIANLNEAKINTATNTTVNGVAFRYTNQAWPTGTSWHVLAVNYYDDYNFPGAPSSFPSIEGQTVFYNQTVKPKGMATGSWIRVLEASTAYAGELVHTFYDAKSRPIRTWSSNHLGGYTQVDAKLDFSGTALYTVTEHKRTSSGSPLIIREDFTYSDQGRLLSHTHKIGSRAAELLSMNSYDELGQLISKKVGGSDLTGSTPLQKIDYSYNTRGWLKEINKVTSLAQQGDPADLFAFKIVYEAPQTAQSQFNGNISETYWRTANDNILRRYAYQFDSMGRLTSASYHKPESVSAPDSYKESQQYDKNGNIVKLQRFGNYDDAVFALMIDDLDYAYESNSNRIAKITDMTNNPAGFWDGANAASNTGDDYSYDINGNIKSDWNKRIDKITYNHLNQPIKVVFNSGGFIEYVYNAAGEKVKKTVTQSPRPIKTQEYLDGFDYANGILEAIPTDEGYVKCSVPEGSDVSIYNYIFNYTDHLGNIRLSYTKDPATQQVVIMEENNYYPLGLSHINYNMTKRVYDRGGGGVIEFCPTCPIPYLYNYKFNGQEFQEELGLKVFDMPARDYDPAIGRWMGIDPVTHYDRSPYNGHDNNPVFWADPSGADVNLWGDSVDADGEDAALFYKALIAALQGKTAKFKVKGKINNFTHIITLPEVDIYVENLGRSWGTFGSEYIMQSWVYRKSGFYEYHFKELRQERWDDFQSTMDVVGIIDPTGVVDGLNAIGYLIRGQNTNAMISAMGIIPYIGDIGKGTKWTKSAAKTGSNGASLSTNGVKLSQHLGQLEKYGAGEFKELANGRFRYYGQATLNKGDANSFRMVREWNPATGGKRTWFETLNPNGGVIQVRPEFGTGVKTHYLFNGTGGYLGKW